MIWSNHSSPHPSISPIALALFSAAAVILASGCGDSGPRRYELSGTVTFDGAPIPAGTIVFQPDSAAGNSGVQGTAEIRDGKYDTAEGGKGMVGGSSIVRIRGFDHFAASEDEAVQELFPEFEIKVDLPKESGTKDFEVPAEAAKVTGRSGRTSGGP